VEGWSYLDSFYLSVVTLTAIGYGDIAPQTDAGKVFTVVTISVGLGIIDACISSLTSTGIDAPTHRGGGTHPHRLRHERNAEGDGSDHPT
jgi:hypothetical protein